MLKILVRVAVMPKEINEYLRFKSDLVIRKDKLTKSVCSDTFQCCVVSVMDKITRMVSEMKVDDKTDYPESECFRNMSMVAPSMVMEIKKRVSS